MGGYRISFDFHGDQQLDRTLARFSDRAQDATPAWDRMADSFEQLNRRQFQASGRAASGGWAPLSPAYAAWKSRHYPGRPILVRTGELRESLTRRPFGVEVIRPGSMEIGTAVPYARFHQQGGPGLPRRRPVELTERARREWVKILQHHLVSTDRGR